jgi:hypothetical protein
MTCETELEPWFLSRPRRHCVSFNGRQGILYQITFLQMNSENQNSAAMSQAATSNHCNVFAFTLPSPETRHGNLLTKCSFIIIIGKTALFEPQPSLEDSADLS